MTWWISIAAVRIHGWIEQTPQLKHMRGASRALRLRTRPEAVSALQGFSDVEVQFAESGVDGVVVATAQDAAVAASYAKALLAHLAHEIPGLQWEGWWCEATSYVEAFNKAMSPDSDVQRILRLPALSESGIIMTCLMCRSEPSRRYQAAAVKRVVTDDKADGESTQGVGCEVRAFEGAVDRRSGGAGIDDLRSELPGRRLAKDFAELARSGGIASQEAVTEALGRKESRSHLATIYADGNGMGAFFQGLATSPLKLPTLHRQAVGFLNKATRNAVVAAARSVSIDPEVVAVEPHFVGGDDVLVSVPASVAWAFAGYLCGQFELLQNTLDGALDSELAQQGAVDQSAVADLKARIAGLSLGVGMAFAHASFPFAQASHAAASAMGKAKYDAKGEQSLIGWIDITHQFAGQGATQVHTVSAFTVRTQLDPAKSTAQAEPVFRLTPAARGALASLLRSDPAGVREWARRLGDSGTAEAIAAASPEQLWADLSRARWWPAVNREEA
jgi:Cas10/Cmr2, second palm domain